MQGGIGMPQDYAYEKRVRAEIRIWERELLKPPNWLQETSSQFSKTLNHKIPEKVHDMITQAVKGMIETALFGASYMPGRPVNRELSLRHRDREAETCIKTYQKTASAEGAFTGFGGLLLGAVDFPALLAIKMKMLFELAHIYGYDMSRQEEKMYALHVFQLTFSQPSHRQTVMTRMKNWEVSISGGKTEGEADLSQLDWRKLQQEYRDYIDFRKMLQLIPGIGAAVGAWVNYKLLEELGQTARNCYRRRDLGISAS